MVTAAMKLKDIAPCFQSYDQPRQHIKMKKQYFANIGLSSQSYDFSSSHVHGCKSWIIKKVECQRIDGFELWC